MIFGMLVELFLDDIGEIARPVSYTHLAEMATQVAPLPKQAIFPLGQHIGAPAKPVVAKGDKVRCV